MLLKSQIPIMLSHLSSVESIDFIFDAAKPFLIRDCKLSGIFWFGHLEVFILPLAMQGISGYN